MNEQNSEADDPTNSDDAYERGARAEGAVESADGASGDTNELSTRDDWQRAVDEQRDRYLRLAAEYDNFRKRATRERQEAGARAMGVMVKGMIDALDDLARFAHVDPATIDPTTLVQGVD